MLTRRSSDADLRHFLFLKVINAPEAARVSAVISTPRSAVAGSDRDDLFALGVDGFRQLETWSAALTQTAQSVTIIAAMIKNENAFFMSVLLSDYSESL